MTQKGVRGTHYKDAPKSRVVALRMTETDMEKLRTAAQRAEMTVPQYLLAEGLKAAQRAEKRAQRAAKKAAETAE